jgi:hypothetical protein
LNRYDIKNLKSLSENTICSIEYSFKDIVEWKEGDISLLLDSNSPQFIKDIIKYKKRPKSPRCKSTWYFGESYLVSILSDYIKEGWFSSFKWLHDPEWLTGKNPYNESDPVIKKLKIDFFANALMKYIGPEKLKNMQKIGIKERAEVDRG